MGSLLAHQISRITGGEGNEELELGLRGAPRYEQFAAAAKQIIRTIHAIPTLWKPVRSLDEVEIYIGRAGATPQHVKQRWRTRREEAQHVYGVVAARCWTFEVEAWETAAIKFLKRLKARGRLCVKNAAAHGQGTLPDTEESCIYVTWKLTGAREVVAPTAADVAAVARETAAEMRELDYDFTRQTLEAGLSVATRPVHERVSLSWSDLVPL
jgi:hypothetical protein